MSIYFQDRIRELANKHLLEDIQALEKKYEQYIIDDVYKTESIEMTDEEFKRYWCVYQIANHNNTNEFHEHWHFYCSDFVIEDIIAEDDEIKYMYSYHDFDTEECLEQAKENRLIEGFFQLSDDLWILNDG